MAEDAGEQIVEVVGDPASEHAQGFQALRPAHDIPHGLLGRDVSYRGHKISLPVDGTRSQGHLGPETSSVAAARAPLEHLGTLVDGLVHPFHGAGLRVRRPFFRDLTDGHADEPFVGIAIDFASALVAIQDAASLGVVDEDSLVDSVVDGLQMFGASAQRGLPLFDGAVAPPQNPVQQQRGGHYEEPALAGVQHLYDDGIVRDADDKVIGERDPQRGDDDIATHDEEQLGTQ